MDAVVSMTGLVVSVAHDEDGRRVLERRRGALADTWPAAPDDVPTPDGPARLVPGSWVDRDHVRFDLGPTTDEPRPFGTDHRPDPAQLAGLVETLRALHRLDPGPETTRPGGHRPDLVERLTSWHRGELPMPDAMSADALHERVARRLGTSRLDRVVSVADRWTDGPRVLLHGFASLGNAGATADARPYWLLTGHHRTGPAEHDLGVLLSDAVELGVGPDLVLPDDLDVDAVLDWALLRLLSHVVDHELFVGPAPDLDLYLDRTAVLLDEPALLLERRWEQLR